MRILTTLLAVAVLGFATACTNTTTTTSENSAAGPRAFKAAKAPRKGKAARAQVYLLRGGFGGVFSVGMNDMAADLRGKGVPAKAQSWTDEKTVLATIEKSYAENRRGPIILVGHSLGAGAVMRISRALTAKNIPVNLVVVLDALTTPDISKGVRRFVSYKASGEKEDPGDFKGAPGFNGRIVNVDIRNLPDLETTGHWSMVQQDAMQQRVMRDILRAYRSG